MTTSLYNSLRRLRPNKQRGVISPHKIALLLAVAQLFEEGLLHENRIEFTPELVATFHKMGQKLAPTYPNTLLIHMPLYHLHTSGLWHLKTLPGFESALTSSYSPKSLVALNDFVEYAYLSPELYSALLDPVERELVRKTLISKYFPEAQFRFADVSKEVKPYLRQLEMDFINGIAAEPANEMDEEVRSTLFKQQVPKIYDYRCAISGLQVSSLSSASMVDACHIEPWSLKHNDTLTNGICLTPTIHRAFDRGLISISTEFKVMVSSKISESESSPYSLLQFESKPLFLPRKEAHWPGREFLEWHSNEVFLA